jgi:Na+/melibiose symporter-like transporter
MLIALGLSFFVTNSTPVALLLMVYIFYNFGLAGMASVTTNILPDVTDVDEMITGHRREGVVSTFSTFVRKTISGFMASITGFILAAFNFNQNIAAQYQPAQAIFGIRITYAVLPIIFVSLSILAAFKYKMTPEDHQLIRRAIQQKKEKDSVNLTQSERDRCSELSGIPFEELWVGQNRGV